MVKWERRKEQMRFAGAKDTARQEPPPVQNDHLKQSLDSIRLFYMETSFWIPESQNPGASNQTSMATACSGTGLYLHDHIE